MPESSTKRVVVSNTGPFISLEQLPDGFELLRLLFDCVLIPKQVLEELAFGLSSPASYLHRYHLKDFVHVMHVTTSDPDLASLDLGETYAIALAEREKLPILLEDRAARRKADKKGLRVMGIAGLLKKAHDRHLLSTEDVMGKLTTLYRARRIPKRIYQQVGKAVQGTE